jgi:hypothetical protein
VPLAAIKDEAIARGGDVACCKEGETRWSRVDAASAAEAEYSARALAAWEAGGSRRAPPGRRHRSRLRSACRSEG